MDVLGAKRDEIVNKVLTQYCTDERLDVLMFSHGDGDHISGIQEMIERSSKEEK